MKAMHDALVSHLAIHSEAWSDAVRYSYRDNELTSKFLATKRMEYTRMQVFSKIDSLKDRLKDNLAGYEKTNYPETYQLYGILSQLSDLAKEPRGSISTFNSTVNNLRNDFSKTLALAELEFQVGWINIT